jgi:hypothetical protein
MRFGRIWRSQRQANVVNRLLQGCQSGQMDLTVNQAGYALRRFESYPLHCFIKLGYARVFATFCMSEVSGPAALSNRQLKHRQSVESPRILPRTILLFPIIHTAFLQYASRASPGRHEYPTAAGPARGSKIHLGSSRHSETATERRFALVHIPMLPGSTLGWQNVVRVNGSLRHAFAGAPERLCCASITALRRDVGIREKTQLSTSH